MNKEQALNKLAALEAETKALRAIIEKPDNQPVRWRPRDGDEYYQVGIMGDSATYSIRLRDIEYEHGNCFKTREQAAIAAKAVSVTLKVCAAAFAVDPDAGGYKKHHREIAVYKAQGQWRAQTFIDDVGAQIYVHSVEKGELMAAMLNAEGV
jgi:hypothetical protein